MNVYIYIYIKYYKDLSDTGIIIQIKTYNIIMFFFLIFNDIVSMVVGKRCDKLGRNFSIINPTGPPL